MRKMYFAPRDALPPVMQLVDRQGKIPRGFNWHG